MARPLTFLILAFALFLGRAGAQTRWSADFGDNQDWNQPQYATTMMFADLNRDGLADVCGRGGAGIYCALSNGHGFNKQYFASNEFSDANGFNNPIYYSTIRLGDVNGDGHPDVCGRGRYAIFCALGKGDGTFNAATPWSTDYTDANGWGNVMYASTIMLGDVNGDLRADVCARGTAGIYCSLSTGNGFGPIRYSNNAEFSNSLGWTDPIYYGSIRIGDVNGDEKADICGRGAAGVYCIVGVGDGTFGASKLWSADFSNTQFSGNGFGQAEFATAMMMGDIDGDHKDDVCMRYFNGGFCASSNGNSFNPMRFVLSYFYDSAPHGTWNSLVYYGTLRLADVNGDGQADICARGVDGIYCAVASPAFF